MDTKESLHFRLGTILGATVLMLIGSTGPLYSQCALGFLTGTGMDTAPNIDGRDTGDWGDASVIQSSTAAGGCLSKLLDGDMVLKNVAAYTKRYNRDSQVFIGMMFEVQDGTTTEAGGGLLTDGERIAVQIDHDGSGGAQLDASDRRIIVTHRWESAAGDPQEVTNVQASWSSGTGTPGVCGGGPRWNAISTPSDFAAAVRKDFPGGYRLELEFPVSAVGGISSDFGIAFQVINDWGVAGDPNSAAASFPATLPYSTLDNAVNGCNTGWRSPDDWGAGYLNTAPIDVYISRNPVPWNSEDITPMACGTPTYTYHPGTPCRLTLQARLRKASGPDQIRNVLFLWADHGASPSTWRVMDLREGVAISGSMTTVTSAEWSDVPTGLPNHPCVRVYILPPFFQADFDRDDILAISTPSELSQMVSVYGVQTQHWAQKNISRATTEPTCTVAGCGIARVHAPFERGMEALLAEGGRLLSKELMAAPDRARSQRDTLDQQEETTGRPIWLSDDDRKVIEGRNALIQIQSIGWTDPGPADSLGYLLAEPLGGLVQVIPLNLVEDAGQWPLQFTVGNPGAFQRQVLLVVDTETPTGTPPLDVRVDTIARRMDSNEEVVIEGLVALGPPETGKCPFGGFGAGAAGLGLLLLGLVGRLRRSR